MKYYFAPLEGITGYRFRREHHRFFPGMDAYYTPFVVATYTKKLKSREKLDVLPENNDGVPTIPQILTNQPEEFLHCAGYMADFGYTEVNLNLGCPVGTVTAKGKGSGMLRTPEVMDRFLDTIYNGAEQILVTKEDGTLRPLRISVKTRLGWEDPAEFEELLAIYRHYPISELIIHARTRQELYRGRPELEAFRKAYGVVGGAVQNEDAAAAEHEASTDEQKGSAAAENTGKRDSTSGSLQLCYNGDIRTKEDIAFLEREFPELDRVMIGRGLLSDPGMITELVTGERPDRKVIRAFHDALYQSYDEQFHDDRIRINCMKELWTFLGESFEDTGRYVKGIHKAKNKLEYGAAVRMLFVNCQLQPLRNGLIDKGI